MPDLDRCVQSDLDGWADQDNRFLKTRRDLYGEQLLGTPGDGLDLNLRGRGRERDLVRMLELNAFTRVERVEYRGSAVRALNGLESRDAQQSALIVEAQK